MHISSLLKLCAALPFLSGAVQGAAPVEQAEAPAASTCDVANPDTAELTSELESLLYSSIWEGEQLDRMRDLLEAGADVRHLRGGDSLLYRANSVGQAKLLVEYGAEYTKDGSLDPRLMSRVAWGLMGPEPEIMDFFVSLGGDMFCEALLGGEQLLEENLEHRYFNPRLVPYLIEHGLDIPSLPGRGHRGLFLACVHGPADLVGLLLKNGAAVNGPDCYASCYIGDYGNPDCTTPLMAAVYNDDARSVRLLLEAGANLSRVNPEGQGVWHIAATNAGTTVLRMLPQETLDVAARDYEDRTPLMLAAMWGNDEAGRFLLEAGADPHVQDAFHRSVLMLAAYGGNAALVQRLLAAGADVHAADPRGWTPLMYAAHEGHTKVARLLLEAGADVNAKDALGRTALTHTYQEGIMHLDTCRMLLEHGADKGLQDRCGVPVPPRYILVHGEDDDE